MHMHMYRVAEKRSRDWIDGDLGTENEYREQETIY